MSWPLLTFAALACGVFSRRITCPTASTLAIAIGGLGFAAVLVQGRLAGVLVALSAAAASLPAAIITLIGQAQAPGDPIEWFDLLACWVTLGASLCCVAPVVLAPIGRPRSAWRSRRINTALPLVVAVGLLSWMIASVQWCRMTGIVRTTLLIAKAF